MKPKYIGFRIFYIIQIKTGIVKLRIPKNPPILNNLITKQQWENMDIPFFYPNKKTTFTLSDPEANELKKRVANIFNNHFIFFSSIKFDLGPNYDWITNPENGYKYDINKHWSEIQDFSDESGDIKFVWEKARFSFLYDIIRYDYHFEKDNSKLIFAQIEDFIDRNPINQGPNYKCSQEIALRLLNWTFALFHYRYSSSLTNELFQKIINSIYWQLKHIYKNINFSRIAVRNNHAITETAVLYLSNLLFPFFKDSIKWSKKGRKWLLKEIDYQIYKDGSYLQFSHNYHRVVIQVLSWVLKINQLNEKTLSNKIIDKLNSTYSFLIHHQENQSGRLPNYGNNDGALFFPLNNNHYRDFRPQLQVFGNLLGYDDYDIRFEDSFWFNSLNKTLPKKTIIQNKILCYINGGFYGIKDDTLTTIRCGKYKDRPYQADALNLDIWYKGTNIIFDPGTYKYNTEKKYLSFYNGTKGHNTLSIGNFDQMFKGGRFIWFFWTKKINAKVDEYSDRYEFEGEIEGFPTAGKNIKHIRKVIKYKNCTYWKIIDKTNYCGPEKISLHWNINPMVERYLDIKAVNSDGKPLELANVEAWNSEFYGVKNTFQQKIVLLPDGYCETTIILNTET